MSLSYSRIALYQACPKQYEFACVKKIPRAISKAESFGTSIHNTLKKWGELEQRIKSPTIADAQLTMFAEPEEVAHAPLTIHTLEDFYHSSFIRSVYANSIEADSEYERGKQAIAHFYEWWQQKERTVHAVEQSFAVQIENTTIKGRFDRIEIADDSLHIIDFKTSKVKEQSIVDEDLQLSVYVLAAKQLWNMDTASVCLLFINAAGVIETKSYRNTDQLQVAAQRIAKAYNGIEVLDFTATPSVETCYKCPYKNICSEAVG